MFTQIAHKSQKTLFKRLKETAEAQMKWSKEHQRPEVHCTRAPEPAGKPEPRLVPEDFQVNVSHREGSLAQLPSLLSGGTCGQAYRIFIAETVQKDGPGPRR